MARATTPTRETALYDRLCQLFETVHQGDPGRNVPAYGGRLFQAAAPANGEPSAASVPFDRMAQFLREHKVADRRLALAIDALSRDRDRDARGPCVHRLQVTRRPAPGLDLRTVAELHASTTKTPRPNRGSSAARVGKETLQRPGVAWRTKTASEKHPARTTRRPRSSNILSQTQSVRSSTRSWTRCVAISARRPRPWTRSQNCRQRTGLAKSATGRSILANLPRLRHGARKMISSSDCSI